MVQISLKNLSKSYGDNKVIEDINLETKEKEFIVLVGPSGSGKSTIIRIIAGLEKDFSGDLYFADELVNSLEPKDRNLSMVFQNYALYPHKTVFDNIAFPLVIRGEKKNDISKKVYGAALKVGLEDYLKRKPAELSGGQKQRVAVARAIVKEPEVFLMDEPLSNLDAKLRASTRQEIRKLYSELRSTFIYVTHDQVEAMSLGDRIAILNDGKIQQFDTPTNVYHDPANSFVASFIGSPPCNILHLTTEKILELNIFESMATAQSLLKATDGGLEIGIRPEFLKLRTKLLMGILEDAGYQESDTRLCAIEIIVTNIENLGEVVLIYGRLSLEFAEDPDSLDEIIAKVNLSDFAELDPQIGYKLELLFDRSYIYLFDKHSKERIR